jgi:hypothetical protein
MSLLLLVPLLRLLHRGCGAVVVGVRGGHRGSTSMLVRGMRLVLPVPIVG